MDFVLDQFTNGQRFRALTIVDVFSREALAIEVGQSLRGEQAFIAFLRRRDLVEQWGPLGRQAD